MRMMIMALGCLAVLAGGARAGTYTLKDLVESAWHTSPDVKKVQEEINKTDAQVREAYGSALPKIDLSVNYQYAFAQYNPLAGSDMGDLPTASDALAGAAMADSTYIPTSGDYALAGYLDGFFSGLTSMFPEQTKQTLVWGISIQQPLFAQGKVGIGLAIAKYYRQSLDDKMADTKNTVQAAVTKLFYGCLLAADNADIQEEALNVALETHRLACLRFNAGAGTELDTLAAKLNVEQARMAHRNARSSLLMAHAALIKQTGIKDVPSELELAGMISAPDYAVTEEVALEKLKQRNLMLLQLEGAAKIQEELVDLAKSDFYPMVYCGAKIGQLALFNAGDKLEWNDDQNVFVGMSVNLFSGGITMQKIKQARADQRSFEQTRQQAADGLELAVLNAGEQLRNSRENLAASESLERLAQKGYDITSKAYEVGMATLVELQKAEAQMKGARLAKNASLMQYTAAAVDMQTLLNELSL